MELKKELYKIEDELKKEIEGVSDYIFKNPELGNEEYKAVEFLIKELEKNNFRVEKNYCGMETAFRAEIGEGSPKIAFLAEYDALPGYGVEKKPGHACGHNWIAASTYGTALVLSKMLDKFNGTIVFIGTPAEETVGGKVPMVESGTFNDVDVVFQMHLESQNNIACKTLAIDCIKFQFKGRASHAAAHPEDGINALDAINLVYAGIGCLRQHITSDARIHGIITHGGDAPNTVPDFTEARFHIRANNREYLNNLTEKVINIAKGASMMTGTEMSWEKFENSFDNLVNLKSLQELMKKNLLEVGIKNIQDEGKGATGSSDIGNVSQVCPTMYTEVALEIEEVCHVHDEAYLKYVNSEEAYEYLNTLKNIIKYTKVSDVSMETGSLRCDANISVMEKGSKVFGTRVEVKNLNSFKAVARAIDYEISRQIETIENGGKIDQETRLWDEETQTTKVMRSKEEAMDYRYFPEPDLLKLVITDEEIEAIRQTMPESKVEKLARFINDYGLPEYDANILCEDIELADYFEKVAKTSGNGKLSANWIMTDVMRILKEKNIDIEKFSISAEHLGEIIALIEKGTISTKIAKELFEIKLTDERAPEVIVKEKGMVQVADTGAIEEIVKQVIANNPQPVADFKSGNGKAIGFLVGQVMKESKGRANPGMVNELLKKFLND